MNIPLNRVVAFVGPYIAVLSGGVAAWLVGKVDVLGLPGVGGKDHVATLIAGGLSGLLTAGLTWLGHSKWLKGHHITLKAEARVASAALIAGEQPPGLDSDVAGITDDELPDDDEELDSIPELSAGEAASGRDPGSPPLRPPVDEVGPVDEGKPFPGGGA